MPFKISRYSVKNPGTEFVDTDNLTAEEQQIRESFFTFARNLPGRIANTVIVTTIDENTVKRTWDMDSPPGKEEMFAGIYMRENGTSTDPARIAYLNMMRAKGESIDVSKCYWEVEYANGHVQTYKFGPNS
jgi:hypothetical protein